MTDSEKKRMRALEDRIYCLESIIEHVSEGVILTDEDCRITVFNPAKERMEHMKASDVMGMVSWEAYTHSNREISEHQWVSDTGQPILNAYRPHAYVNDVPVYIYYSTYPVIRDGRILGAYTISRNEEILRELLYETIEQKRGNYNPEKTLPTEKCTAPGTSFTFSDVVGKSPQMKKLIKDAQMVSGTEASILILGETGTGKEVLAQSIHNFSRKDKKFIAINCAAIPDGLLESTLFGSVRGAFTGALDRQGLFTAAGDGTLFLDEINSMSVNMQSKLLRALQEKCIRPVGSLKEEPIRCRLICASNEKVETLLTEGRMRSDLFYRISDFILSIPPLRERKEDILEMAEMFIHQYNQKFHKNIVTISHELKLRLLGSQWTGNTRELEHVIRNLMLRVPELDTELTARDYPSYLFETGPELQRENPSKAVLRPTLQDSLTLLQRELICDALRKHHGNMTQAARELGIQRQNLAQRMKRLNIDPDQ